ncbi:MAG: MFS transporter [Erythrobacter sp.]|uniref:MFS transporter n=1 Tax=Erythrobacter sp. TaxID=1042 RepID=UPI0032EE32A9
MTARQDSLITSLVLAERRGLRLFTLFLFYLNQGIAPGFFAFALPAWLAVGGVSTAGIATVVAAAGLPWTLKFLNGFVIDRYTFLPMGRRRVWIIGAQATLLCVLVTGAFAAPEPGEIALIAALAFAANLAVNFQDVGIDALAIDLMPEEERAQAAGLMMGAQVVGLALTVAASGWMIETYGLTAALLVVALVPLLTIGYGLAILERPGERRLPWSAGETHRRNRALHVADWRPLIAGAFRALLAPLSLAFVPLLLLRALPSGVYETFLPKLFTGGLGWSLTTFTSLLALQAVVSGLYAILLGGRLVERFGERRIYIACTAILALWNALFAALPMLWQDVAFLIAFTVVVELSIMTYTIALVPVSMRLCVPSVAATQFVVYMGMGGAGRPLGAWLASAADGAGAPQAMFAAIALATGAASLYAVRTRLPEGSHDAADNASAALPQASGIAPRFD